MGDNKLVLNSDTKLLSRRAQSLDSELTEVLRGVCNQNHEIRACYVLDAKRPESDEMKLLIAVSLEDEAQHFDDVTAEFQEALRPFPKVAEKVFIMSSRPFVQRYAGFEFYKRDVPGLDRGFAT